MLLAREHKLDVEEYPLQGKIRIGKKWYYHHINATCALLVAFDTAGIPIPPEIRARPEDID
jgi:hypothetical protein